ncbi:hypothetical protein SCUCBS95973_006399 [Sporothrix curviconia]|uniref:Uncharacterized protein n=1 Tax=Sporothrix curviconia TaxID=1260050 RepID=A0ABP0C5U0_9PEZI
MGFVTYLSYAIAFLASIVAVLFAYEQGYLDPLIEKLGVYLFKAKAKAEEKELEAEGLQAGQDFVKGQLTGSQQATDVKLGLGSIGGLKKNA